MRFRVANSSGTMTERMRIDGGTGNVGIGVTDPDSKLEINTADNDTTTALKVLALDDGGYTGTVMEVYGTRGPTTAYNIAKFGTNAGTAKIVFDGEGKVGIGTSFPSSSLDVAGGIIEQGGVLKENLLTNSGFDVWSNSTLVNPTTGVAPVCDDAGDLFENGDAGEALTTGWTDNSGGGSSVVIASNQWDFDGAVAYAILSSDALTVTKGKLYQIGYDVITAGHANDELQIGTSSGGSQVVQLQGPYITTGTGTGFKVTWEATVSGTVYVTFRTGYSTKKLDNLMMHEVTPGCVAVNNLAMDGWYKEWAGSNYPDIYRHHDVSAEDDASRNTKDGSFYSLKFTATETSAHHTVAWPSPTLNDSETWRNRVRGRTLTLGCWVKGGAGFAQIGVKYHDGSWQSYNATNTGTAWEWLEVTHTIPTDAEQIQVILQSDTNTQTVYFSQPMLVFGSSIGEGNYTRPVGEWIYAEKQSGGQCRLSDNTTSVTGFGTTIIHQINATINLEALSYGRIPKGIKAIKGHVICTQASAGNYVAIQPAPGMNSGTFSYAVNANNPRGFSYDLGCDINGDMAVATEGAMTGVSFYWDAVQLR
jgi:hypothetical protein